LGERRGGDQRQPEGNNEAHDPAAR
jgi:hypothetical protein